MDVRCSLNYNNFSTVCALPFMTLQAERQTAKEDLKAVTKSAKSGYNLCSGVRTDRVKARDWSFSGERKAIR